jgi:hypothetical protein
MDSTRSIGGTIPISLSHWAVIVRTGSSSSYFGIFQLGWATLFLFLFNGLLTYMYVLVDEFNRSIGTIPTSLTHWRVIVRTGSSSSNYFGISSTRMGPNPLFLFSTLQWVVTYMWLLVDEFNSYWWNYPHFFDTLRPLLYVQALPAPTIFGIFRMGPFRFPFQHAPMGCNVHVTTVDEFNSWY